MAEIVRLAESQHDPLVEMPGRPDRDFMSELEKGPRSEHDDEQPDDKQHPVLVELGSDFTSPANTSLISVSAVAAGQPANFCYLK